MQAYSNPAREDDPYALPDVEVFYMSQDDIFNAGGDSVWFTMRMGSADEYSPIALFLAAEELAGFYYWYCFPGCLPDSDAIGPFASEQAALEDAREDSED